MDVKWTGLYKPQSPQLQPLPITKKRSNQNMILFANVRYNVDERGTSIIGTKAINQIVLFIIRGCIRRLEITESRVFIDNKLLLSVVGCNSKGNRQTMF